MLYKTLIFFAGLCLSLCSKALTISEQQSNNLSSHPYWHKLLKYKPQGDNFYSEVTTDEFFLSSLGRGNPKAELEANIALLSVPNHPKKCKFVERYHWLTKQLNLPKEKFNLKNCSEFQEWARLDKIQSASLVYASGYLGNPASFFGHILLKLNYPTNVVGANSLLDTSINFGAAIPAEDNAFVYVFKGFFGGYFAGFKEDSFFRHHHSYAEQESRALWDYQLDLSQEQLHSLVRHSWELKQQKFDYYYLNDNCASRMAELIDVVADTELTEPAFPWVQPITIFQKAKNPQNELVKSISKFPSHHDKFLNSYQLLTSKEKSVVLELDKALDFKISTYQALNNKEKVNVVNVLMNYFEYRHKLGDESVKPLKNLALRERFKLPIGTTSGSSKEVAPHLGHFPVLTQLSASSSKQFGSSLKFRLRPTYYDLLSKDTGRLANSSLAMGDTQLEITERGVRLKRFDFANILSLNPAQTDLESDSGLAWKIRFGLESGQSECYDCLLGLAELGLGKSIFINNILTYGMLEVRAQTRSTWVNPVSTFAKIGALIQPSNVWKSHIEVDQLLTGDANHSKGYLPKWNLSWNNRFGNSRDWDIRINLTSNEIENTSEIGLSLYW
jgi:hypothetical protein